MVALKASLPLSIHDSIMAEGGTLDGPDIGGFSSGDISLTAPSYAQPRPRALSTVSSRRPRRQVTPSVVSREDGEGQQTQSRGSEQTAAAGNDEDAGQDSEAELMNRATEPVKGWRMRYGELYLIEEGIEIADGRPSLCTAG